MLGRAGQKLKQGLGEATNVAQMRRPCFYLLLLFSSSIVYFLVFGFCFFFFLCFFGLVGRLCPILKLGL